jgi:hypothetical protein
VEILPIGAHAENWDWEYKQQGNERYFSPHLAILQAAKANESERSARSLA